MTSRNFSVDLVFVDRLKHTFSMSLEVSNKDHIKHRYFLVKKTLKNVSLSLFSLILQQKEKELVLCINES